MKDLIGKYVHIKDASTYDYIKGLAKKRGYLFDELYSTVYEEAFPFMKFYEKTVIEDSVRDAKVGNELTIGECIDLLMKEKEIVTIEIYDDLTVTFDKDRVIINGNSINVHKDVFKPVVDKFNEYYD
jgi:hypothetical protein